MHSRSTYTLIGLGGLEGRALQEGDELEVGEGEIAPTGLARPWTRITSPPTPKRRSCV